MAQPRTSDKVVALFALVLLSGLLSAQAQVLPPTSGSRVAQDIYRPEGCRFGGYRHFLTAENLNVINPSTDAYITDRVAFFPGFNITFFPRADCKADPGQGNPNQKSALFACVEIQVLQPIFTPSQPTTYRALGYFGERHGPMEPNRVYFARPGPSKVLMQRLPGILGGTAGFRFYAQGTTFADRTMGVSSTGRAFLSAYAGGGCSGQCNCAFIAKYVANSGWADLW